MATRAKPKKPIAVRVHPINVGQGDAILLEVKYDNGSSKKCLIDGGRGQKLTKNKETPFSNLTTALANNNCIEKPPSISSGEKTWRDRTYRQITLDSIVNTHPDADHHGGINALLGTGSKEIKSGEKFTVCCPIITTSATSLYVEVPDEKNEHKNGAKYSSAESDCLQFWFQQNAPGQIHTRLENLPQKSTVEIHKNPSFQGDNNATSIVTTVKLPESKYDYDVVLTGDSYGGIILDTLRLKPNQSLPRRQTSSQQIFEPKENPVTKTIRPKPDLSQIDFSDEEPNPSRKQNPNRVLKPDSSEETKRKTVGIFQVPHHGSRENSTMASTKGRGSNMICCMEFYMQFDADVYLISHGIHLRYKHPHSEVITGILSAAVQKKKRCKIVVTATQFEESKIDDTNISNWRDYVDIFYFKQGTPYVTLDPNDEKLPEGLQLYTREEERDKREHSMSVNSPVPNKAEETPIKEDSTSRSKRMYPKTLRWNPVPDERFTLSESLQTIVQQGSKDRVASTCEDRGRTNPATPAGEVGIESHELDCTVCGEQTEPTCVIMCKQCNSRAHANKVCTRYARASKNYLCAKCRTCTVCNELTNESGTYTAVCKLCGSRAHANAETNCTRYNKATQESKNYICIKCRTCIICNNVTDKFGTEVIKCSVCGACAHVNCVCHKCNQDIQSSKQLCCQFL